MKNIVWEACVFTLITSGLAFTIGGPAIWGAFIIGWACGVAWCFIVRVGYLRREIKREGQR